jgi:L-fuconate dehydratase
MIQHYGLWDQISVSGHSENQLVEYIDFLQDVLVHPVRVQDGFYVAPTNPGWGLEFDAEFIQRHRYPEGEVWAERDPKHKGVLFEV